MFTIVRRQEFDGRSTSVDWVVKKNGEMFWSEGIYVHSFTTKKAAEGFIATQK